ncbi:dsRBD fold-containing protein [Amycolatopsis sp. NPDC003865]
MTDGSGSWRLDVAVHPGPRRTRAQIVLRTPDGHEFSGVGVALADGPDHVSGYLALGRAMSDLTEELVEAASAELEAEARQAWSP